VKIYGAGGFRGMEGYQSGILISEEGYILTVFSYVLDSNSLRAILDDGRRFDAQLIGADPRLEIAVLKIDAIGLLYFDLEEAEPVDAGQRVLALSNLFGVATGDESVSVQHGVVSVRAPLSGRRGVFETPYQGDVYVLDAMTNNPGAAGGALITRDGHLVAMLGKELRNAESNTWLNYAVPIEELRESVESIRAGKFTAATAPPAVRPERALDLELLGLVLVPDVLERTPPYVERVRTGSPAETAGMRPDDLILLLDDRLIQSCKALFTELETIDFEDPVSLVVLRGQELLTFDLQAKLDAGELP
jgi:S1-C subfamily serine protease